MSQHQEAIVPDVEASDGSLLRRFQHGSDDAATQIYLRYAKRLRALARRKCSAELATQVEIDDIVQSVFGSFFRGASRGCYDVPRGEELWKLFLTIALNKIRSKGKYHSRERRDSRRTVGGEALDLVERADAEQEWAFVRLVMQDAMAEFSPAQREVTLLRIDGYDVAEISDKTGHSKRTVERTLQKVRERLAAIFQAEQ